MINEPISFIDFIQDFTTNNCVAHSKTAQYIYENIICREDVRIQMAALSDVGITALSACAIEIEKICSEPTSDLNLSTKVIRQTIGRMVAASLKPLGYVPYKRGRVNASENSFFSTAKVYECTGKATQKIIKSIVPLED